MKLFEELGKLIVEKIGIKTPLISWLSEKINCYARPKTKVLKIDKF